MKFIVTEKAQRPARMDGTCFYCQQAIGAEHKADCALIRKKVKVRLTVEYEIEVPADCGKEMVEFRRNDGTWCSDYLLGELERLREKTGCLCPAAHYTYLGAITEPYLDEK